MIYMTTQPLKRYCYLILMFLELAMLGCWIPPVYLVSTVIAASPPGTTIPKATAASLVFFCLILYVLSPEHADVGRVLTKKQVLPPRKRSRLRGHPQRPQSGAAEEAAGVDGAEADVPRHVLAGALGVSRVGGQLWVADWPVAGAVYFS